MQLVTNQLIRATRKIGCALLPRRLRLSLRYRLHLLDDCEKELRYLDRFMPRGGVAIDVGANEGMYTFALSRSFEKVYAFEINEDVTTDLAVFGAQNIELIHKGLSSKNSSTTLYIPVLRGLPLTGWASLAPGNCPDTQDHVLKHAETCVLDAFELKNVTFVKIDVEGHEVEVLKGSTQTIDDNRPLFLIEVKDSNLDAVCSFFTHRQYEMKTLDELIGIKGSRENFFFVPFEKTYIL